MGKEAEAEAEAEAEKQKQKQKSRSHLRLHIYLPRVPMVTVNTPSYGSVGIQSQREMPEEEVVLCMR